MIDQFAGQDPHTYRSGYKGKSHGNKDGFLYEKGMVFIQEPWEEENMVYRNTNPGFAYLPHSCDAWVIGGPDNVRAMIADLQAALETMEGK